MKHEFAGLALWGIALAATIITDGTTAIPVFAICMIGTVFVIRTAKKLR